MTHFVNIRTPLRCNDAGWETWELKDDEARLSADLVIALAQADPTNVFFETPHLDEAPCALCDLLCAILYQEED